LLYGKAICPQMMRVGGFCVLLRYGEDEFAGSRQIAPLYGAS